MLDGYEEVDGYIHRSSQKVKPLTTAIENVIVPGGGCGCKGTAAAAAAAAAALVVVVK